MAPNAKSILSFDERRCSDRRERAKLKTRLRYVFGGRLGDIPVLGPVVGIAFNTLAWLVAAQMVALHAGRARFVESDAPRGLTKTML